MNLKCFFLGHDYPEHYKELDFVMRWKGQPMEKVKINICIRCLDLKLEGWETYKSVYFGSKKD